MSSRILLSILLVSTLVSCGAPSSTTRNTASGIQITSGGSGALRPLQAVGSTQALMSTLLPSGNESFGFILPAEWTTDDTAKDLTLVSGKSRIVVTQTTLT